MNGSTRRFLLIVAGICVVGGMLAMLVAGIHAIGITADEAVVFSQARDAAQTLGKMPVGALLRMPYALMLRMLAVVEPLAQRQAVGRCVCAVLALISIGLLAWRAGRDTLTSRLAIMIIGLSALWLGLVLETSPAAVSVTAVCLALSGFTWVWPNTTWRGFLCYCISIAMARLLSPSAAPLAIVQSAWLGVAAVVAAIRPRTRAHVGWYVAACVMGIAVWNDYLVAAASQAQWRLQWAYAGVLWSTLTTMTIGDTHAAHWWQHLIVALVGLAAAAVAVRSLVRVRGVAGVLLVFLLISMMMYQSVAASSPGAIMFRNGWFAWPVLACLAALGAGGIAGRSLALSGRVRNRYARWSAYSVIAVGCVLLTTLWVTAQVRAALIKATHVADRDVAAPATFLQRTAGDGAVQYADQYDPHVEPITRYALAAVLDAKSGRVTLTESTMSGDYAHVGGAWFVGRTLPQLSGPVRMVLPFVVPITYECGTNAWHPMDALAILEQASGAAPWSAAFHTALMEWYKSAGAANARAAVLAGLATRDLAPRVAALSMPLTRRAAANAVLYAWSDVENIHASAASYSIFHDYVTAVGRSVLDRERVAYVYRIYLEDALAATNTAAAQMMLADARAWAPNDAHFLRLASRLVLLENPAALRRAMRLNARANRVYQRQCGRPYIDALFANVLLARAQGKYDEVLARCNAILALLVQQQRAAATNATNVAEHVVHQRARQDEQRLFWEAQCNSYIALLLMATGDYSNAIVWQTKNLDERYDHVRHRVSNERLADMYLALGDIERALSKYEALAQASTSAYERLYWLLQSAQVNVTYGDAVAVFGLWSELERELAGLDDEGRQRWTKDRQLQRVLRYVQRQLNVDVRDTAEEALRRRIEHEPQNADWCYRQIAQLQRCRLQYTRAAATYAEALKAPHPSRDTFLDAGLFFYRQQQYTSAALMFSNLLMRLPDSVDETFSNDWRVMVLRPLWQQTKPPTLVDIFTWADLHGTLPRDSAEWYTARGNLYALYGDIEHATNAFARGIAARPTAVENYLDLGYLSCVRADSEDAGRILDAVQALFPTGAVPWHVQQDWRMVELFHVGIRPYLVEE